MDQKSGQENMAAVDTWPLWGGGGGGGVPVSPGPTVFEHGEFPSKLKRTS